MVVALVVWREIVILLVACQLSEGVFLVRFEHSWARCDGSSMNISFSKFRGR